MKTVESISLRKRFCKDCNLPINLYDSPYFEQRLSTIDPLFDCITDYEVFKDEINIFANEEEYFAYYNRVKDNAIKYITERPSYETFSNSDVPTLNKYPRKELYSDCNDGKVFFSIDMRKANFSVLSTLYPDLVCYREHWDDFIKMFTEFDHIKNSKYIRQVILGACNPKKQTQWERFLMENVAMSIERSLNLCHIISVSTDEILIESESPVSMSSMELNSIVDRECKSISHLLKVTKFKLRKLEGFGWVKQFLHPSSTDYVLPECYEFKCVEADKFHILAKLYRGEEITDDDLVFYNNGHLARYLNKEEFNLLSDI